MPYYDVTIFEVYTQKFRVEADNPAAAVKRTENREDVCKEGGAEYLEEASEYSTPLGELARSLKIPLDEFVSQLEEEDVGIESASEEGCENDRIPAIKDVELSDDQND